MTAAEHLGAALFLLSNQRPYLSHAIWSMRPHECAGLGSMAVDAGWRLLYDPQAIQRWTVRQLAAVCLHELSHLLRDHASRGQDKADSHLWNLAADAEINDDLIREAGIGADLPKGAILPAYFGMPEDLLAEEYYAQGIGEIPPAPGAAPATRVCGGGAATGVCGGCVTGEVFDMPGLSAPMQPHEAKFVALIVAREVLEHAKTALPGTRPSSWVRWADDLLNPQVDWRRRFAALVRRGLARTAGATDYTYQLPSRRQSAAGNVILPKLVTFTPEVAIVVDTSASIGAAQLNVFVSELKGALRALGHKPLTVISVDSAVQTSRRVSRLDQLELMGGGGTDMGAGLAAASLLRPRPTLCVVLTDGHTPWPAGPPPRMSVLIACTTAESCPAWADVVRIQDAHSRP
jgi:predicted metal-dependent peptidase